MQSDFSKCILLLIFLTLTMVAFILIFNEIVGGVNISLNKYSTPCDSHETFFEERCLRIGSVDSCPRNMALFDGPNNRGFCDCWVLDDKPAFYSNETGDCSLHNTQGPCSHGEWFVLKNGTPECQPVPEGCPANGRYFYGTPNETMANQCWELLTQGPCRKGQVLKIKEGLDLEIVCDYRHDDSKNAVSAGMLGKCRPGTLRARSGHCSGVFRVG
ncbi:uncharacterized protein LOC124197355 [Daphnia pulex]|uniref:uncharacterized protein LOC124197355 n=1 Tax=Daphnia pulex TaxID=6669 RepID=UPI001EE0BB07|nr:uncharacterized protein LOC124197355 [Daphnia pulex]